ncbi:MAG TPA: hypothetical protein VK206_21360 [Anaerolineales bacterium]|nr:hypothetical protein [Anaerolineales bacterium]
MPRPYKEPTMARDVAYRKVEKHIEATESKGANNPSDRYLM